MTSTRRVLLFSSLLLGLGAGCSLQGERLATGMCPAGETCFEADDCPPGMTCSAAVNGLLFAGTTPGPHAVQAIAVGGTQQLRTVTTSNLEGPSYSDPFLATSSDPSVIAIADSTPPTITLRADAAGTAYLRVLEPTTGLLLDRVEIRADVATDVAIVDSILPFFGAVEPDWAAYHGSTATVLVVPTSATGETLWDDDMRWLEHPDVDPSAGLVAGFSDDVTIPESGSLDASVSIGGGTLVGSVPVVARIDALERLFPSGPIELAVGASQSICVLARSAGRPVIGAPVVFETSGGIRIVPPEPAATTMSSCATIEGVSAGAGTLVASLDGESVTISVDIGAAGAASASLSSSDALDVRAYLGRATAGERAASSR